MVEFIMIKTAYNKSTFLFVHLLLSLIKYEHLLALFLQFLQNKVPHKDFVIF